MEYFVTDYNYLVLVLAKYISKNNLGDGDNFINLFKVEGAKDKNKRKNGILNNLYLINIFEGYWKIIYVNGATTQKKYLSYSIPAIYKNDKTAVQFGSIMFIKKTLSELINDEQIIKEFDEISAISEAQQVAFSNSTRMNCGINCQDWWSENAEKYTKKMYLSSDTMSV